MSSYAVSINFIQEVNMYWVITIMLVFHGTETTIEREYRAKSFQNKWSCHQFIHENKILLIDQHIIDYGDNLKSFELFCESRYGEEV